MTAPDRCEQTVDRHRVVQTNSKRRKHHALVSPPERYRTPVYVRLNGAKEAYFKFIDD